MEGKRTKIDFSEHVVSVTQTEEVLIHHLYIPNTSVHNIKYINCGGVLSVTGDFGNWIFCREFHPSVNGYISDGYWHEKLMIASSQDGTEFDSESTKQELEERLKEYREENSDNINEDIVEYYERCIDNCYENELDYTYYAYRERPDGIDYEDVILMKDYQFWLKAVFDGFEEICRRIKENELVIKESSK